MSAGNILVRIANSKNNITIAWSCTIRHIYTVHCDISLTVKNSFTVIVFWNSTFNSVINITKNETCRNLFGYFKVGITILVGAKFISPLELREFNVLILSFEFSSLSCAISSAATRKSWVRKTRRDKTKCQNRH